MAAGAVLVPAVIDHHEEHLVRYLPTPRNLINVGAHHGLWCRRFRSAESIIAIEADIHNAGILCGLQMPNMAIYHKAGWSESGKMLAFNRRDITIGMQGSLSCIDPIGTDHLSETVFVETLAVDDLSAPCDLFICDVEGAETSVVTGAMKTIIKHHPVVLIECHTLDNFRLIEAMLSNHGYNITMLHQPTKEVDDPKWWSEIHLLGVHYRGFVANVFKK